MNLALNNQQRLICHKTQTDKKNFQFLFTRLLGPSQARKLYMVLLSLSFSTTFFVLWQGQNVHRSFRLIGILTKKVVEQESERNTSYNWGT